MGRAGTRTAPHPRGSGAVGVATWRQPLRPPWPRSWPRPCCRSASRSGPRGHRCRGSSACRCRTGGRPSRRRRGWCRWLGGAAGGERAATGTGDRGLDVRRVDVGLHSVSPRVVAAGSCVARRAHVNRAVLQCARSGTRRPNAAAVGVVPVNPQRVKQSERDLGGGQSSPLRIPPALGVVFCTCMQELVVALGLAQLRRAAARSPAAGRGRCSTRRRFQVILSSSFAMQDLLLAGAGDVDVDGREDPLVREASVELELHVARALELLEDHLVHLRAGLDQGGRQDGQRAAVLDVARRTEEPLRRVERAGVDTTGQDAPGRRRREVVGATEPGDRVEQDDDVVAQLDEALGALDRQLGDGRVVLGRPVEGRGDDLTLDRALSCR